MEVIACIPVSIAPEQPGVSKITAFEEVACPQCGKLMWLSSRSKQRHEATGTPLICMLCVSSHEVGLVLDEA